MKAQDFRIGNLVNTKYGVKKITQISIDGKSQIDESEPIELTEETLLKCGFEKINKDGVYYALNQIRLDSDFEPFTFDNEGFGWVTIGIKLNYLHQLQNLYYTLIGQELEVNI